MFLAFVTHAAPPPVITAQPADTTVVNGGTATFTVTASSSTGLSYQWYRDGLLILDELLTGETRSALVLNGVSDDGKYFVKVSNAGGTVTSRKAQLTVVPNTPPVASPDNYTTAEDVTLVVPVAGILTNDSDINGQTLVPVLLTNVTQGSLTLSPNGSFIYTPPSNFFGGVSFTYAASDSYPVLAEQSTVSFNEHEIRNGNAGSQSFRHGTAGDASYMINKLVIYLSRKTGNSGNLNFSIGTGINSGAIAGTAKAIPSSSITNTSEGTSFQMYSITYTTPVGPFTAGTTYYLNFDTPSEARFYVDHAPNTYANGTYYDRGVNQNEDLKFSLYKTYLSNPATVSINVTPVNDAPVAGIDWIGVLEDTTTPLIVLTNDYDIEGSPLTITGVTTTNGTAFVSGTNIVFTPATNYYGWTILSYTISDGSLSATGYVAALVYNVNDAPVPANDAYTTPEDTVLSIAAPGVTANDFDVETNALYVYVWNNVTHGTLNLNTNGAFIYVPHTNFYGTDSFTYVEHDGQTWSTNLTTVTINVTPVNDAPIAARDSFSFSQNTSGGVSGHALSTVLPTGSVLLNDTDAENNSLTAVLVSGPTYGSLVLNPNGTFTYTPTNGYAGKDSFTYRAFDGTSYSDVTTVSLKIASATPVTVTLGASQMTPAGFQFQLLGPSDSSFVIFASTDLNNWTAIGTNALGGGTRTFTDTQSTKFPHRFYRAAAQILPEAAVPVSEP